MSEATISPAASAASSGAASIRASSEFGIGPVTAREPVQHRHDGDEKHHHGEQRALHQHAHTPARAHRIADAEPGSRRSQRRQALRSRIVTSPASRESAARIIVAVGGPSTGPEGVMESAGAWTTRVRSSSKPSFTCTLSTGAGHDARVDAGREGLPGRLRWRVFDEADRQVRQLHRDRRP